MEQACYKPQIRPDEEGEEVGPMVGPTGICDVWRSIIHDERGILSGLGTGINGERDDIGRRCSKDWEYIVISEALAEGGLIVHQ